MIKKIKNRIINISEKIFNKNILHATNKLKTDFEVMFHKGLDYWSEVAIEICRASNHEGGKQFFKSPIVINHLASEDHELGYKLLNKIQAHPLGFGLLNKCSTPPWGTPYLLRRYPFLSPTTASHIANILAIQDVFTLDVSNFKNFIDFGGGYGGLARCILQTSNSTDVSIIDLPNMHKVQRNYLSSTTNLIKNIKFYSLPNELEQLEYDIFNASFSMSEVPLARRVEIENLIFNKCIRCFIIFQDNFNGINNNSYMFELNKKLLDNGWHVVIEKYKWYDTGCHFLAATNIKKCNFYAE